MREFSEENYQKIELKEGDDIATHLQREVLLAMDEDYSEALLKDTKRFEQYSKRVREYIDENLNIVEKVKKDEAGVVREILGIFYN